MNKIGTKNPPEPKAVERIFLLQALRECEMLEKQAPDNVDPAPHDTEDGNKDSDYYRKHAALAVYDRRPTNEYFGYPVNAGDQKKYDLYQAGQTVETAVDGHFLYLLYYTGIKHPYKNYITLYT